MENAQSSSRALSFIFIKKLFSLFILVLDGSPWSRIESSTRIKSDKNVTKFMVLSPSHFSIHTRLRLHLSWDFSQNQRRRRQRMWMRKERQHVKELKWSVNANNGNCHFRVLFTPFSPSVASFLPAASLRLSQHSTFSFPTLQHIHLYLSTYTQHSSSRICLNSMMDGIVSAAAHENS